MKVRPALPPIDPHQRYTPEECALYLRSSRFSVFADIREGRLESFKDGARRYITGEALIRRSRAPQGQPSAISKQPQTTQAA